MPFFKTAWKEIVFFVGEVRHQPSFPWVTWAKRKHLVDYDEILGVLPQIKYGDVGLHRDMGYLSNVFIPGFMKHAWLHTEDGINKPQIIEAIREGVIKRSAIYPLFSDFSIILSPKNVTDEERSGACHKMNGILGADYDVDFKFEIEDELKFYTGEDADGAVVDLEKGQQHLKKYKYAFSCSEAVSYSWWHKREQLRLYRKVRKGYNCILPDDFLNHGWEIKWVSKSVTIEAAREIGLHEEGVQMIAEFLKNVAGKEAPKE